MFRENFYDHTPHQPNPQPLDTPNEQTLLLREIRASLQALEEASDLE